MDLEQLQEKFHKLEEGAGKEASSALLQIIELKMSDFKSYIEQKFASVDDKFTSMNEKFEQMDEKFEQKFTSMNEKFEQKFTSIEQRFTPIEQRFTSIQWMIGISFTALGLLIVLLKLF